MYNYFFLMPLLVIILSCQTRSKSDVINSPVITSTTKAVKVPADLPGNPENPYDSAGRLHNSILDATRLYIRNSGDTTTSGIREFTVQYFKKYYNTDVRNAIEHIPNNMADQLMKDYRKVIFARPLDELTSSYLRQIIDTISNSGELLFKDFNAKIISIEKNILADKNLNSVDRTKLLYTTSVARYSGYYWDKILQGVPGIYVEGRGWRWLKRATAWACTVFGDISGAFIAYMSFGYYEVIATAGFISVATWGGMTYYNNW